MTRSGTFQIAHVDPEWERTVMEFLTEEHMAFAARDPRGLVPLGGAVLYEMRIEFSWDPFADPLYFTPPRGVRAKLRWIWRVATWKPALLR